MGVSRQWRVAVVLTGVGIFGTLGIAGSFPLSWVKRSVEGKLSEQFGSPARIGDIRRESFFSLAPVIRIAEVEVAQPSWAGRGKLAEIRLLRLKLGLIPLLFGQSEPELLQASGVRLNLRRDAQGRKNWQADPESSRRGNSQGVGIAQVEDAEIQYIDAVQQRSARVRVTVHPHRGLVLEGDGSVDGAPIRIRATGGPLQTGRPWHFDARIKGRSLAVHAKGQMAGPLRTEDMQFAMTSRADDLKRLDRVIEAGLFGTRSIDLKAQVRHRDDTWTINNLAGRIGRSQLAGDVVARRVAERMKLEGRVRFSVLDFEDLASEQGNAQASALEKAQGLRLVPNTRVNIRKIDRTDGKITVEVKRILSGRRPSALTSLHGLLTLDHRLLTVEPLRLGLQRGNITGRIVVDQRDGQAKPRVMLALNLSDSRISALAGGPDAKVEGRVDARVRLSGVGDTIREAVGTSNGRIGIAARSGTMPSEMAALLGFDIGKGIFGGDAGTASLRCAVVALQMKKGQGIADQLLVDTSISQTTGQGQIAFPEERLDLRFAGAPKTKAALRLPGQIFVRGTLRAPQVVITEGTKSAGVLFKALGRAIAGKNGPQATDGDCSRLIAGVLSVK